MFYLIECIYKRTHSRSINEIQGLAEIYPSLGIAIWAMLILFAGLPGTMKFLAEFYVISLLVEFNNIIALVFLFILVLFGSVGFFKQ
jgi:NADH-quinone oxidoreductase subunit M